MSLLELKITTLFCRCLRRAIKKNFDLGSTYLVKIKTFRWVSGVNRLALIFQSTLEMIDFSASFEKDLYKKDPI